MTNTQALDFLKVAQSINPEIEDYVDAFAWALTQVPKIGDQVWLGSIGNGVYMAESYTNRWFPNTSIEEAARLLVGEMI